MRSMSKPGSAASTLSATVRLETKLRLSSATSSRARRTTSVKSVITPSSAEPIIGQAAGQPAADLDAGTRPDASRRKASVQSPGGVWSSARGHGSTQTSAADRRRAVPCVPGPGSRRSRHTARRRHRPRSIRHPVPRSGSGRRHPWRPRRRSGRRRVALVLERAVHPQAAIAWPQPHAAVALRSGAVRLQDRAGPGNGRSAGAPARRVASMRTARPVSGSV